MNLEFRSIILFIQTETGEIVSLLVVKLREHSIAYTEEPTAYKHINKQTNNNNQNTITSDSTASNDTITQERIGYV